MAGRGNALQGRFTNCLPSKAMLVTQRREVREVREGYNGLSSLVTLEMAEYGGRPGKYL